MDNNNNNNQEVMQPGVVPAQPETVEIPIQPVPAAPMPVVEPVQPETVEIPIQSMPAESPMVQQIPEIDPTVNVPTPVSMVEQPNTVTNIVPTLEQTLVVPNSLPEVSEPAPAENEPVLPTVTTGDVGTTDGNMEPANLDTVTEIPTINPEINVNYEGEINPSNVTATLSEVMGDKPLSDANEIPETFSMADFYKPNVDFSKKTEEPVEKPATPVVHVDVPKHNKSKKGLLIAIVIIVVLGLGVGAYFLFFGKDTKDDDKKKEEPKETPWNEQRPDWDSKTSKIKIDKDATTLVCTYEEEMDGTTNKIIYTHVYKDGVYTQVAIEDELIFTEDTIKYYDYYAGSGKEEITYQEETYDNITIEVREKKISVSLAYSFDLTANVDNPKNMLDNKDVTYDDMKLMMEKDGFTCK